MKSILVIALILNSTQVFADTRDDRCKSGAQSLASQLSAYLGEQSSACVDELNKPGSQRNKRVINANCKNVGQVLQIQQQAIAGCASCRQVDGFAEICVDNGAQSFIDAVGQL